MKSKNKLILLSLLMAGLVSTIGFYVYQHYANKGPRHDHGQEMQAQEYWTCPMHPQIHQSGPGQCPICGMDLVPVKPKNKSAPGQQHEGDTSKNEGIEIDPILVQNIGIKTDTVMVRNLNKIVFTYGRVAHDPSLWVAQNEYLEALRLGNTALIQSVEYKLRFMGLSDEWIKNLRKKRKADLGFHLPSDKEPPLFEAYIYQSDFNAIKVGLPVDILDQDGQLLQKGEIESIATMLDPETKSLKVLIRAKESLHVKSNTFMQFKIFIPLGEKLSVPQEAVLFFGDHNMVYVKAGNHYITKKVEVGQEANGFYEIISGVEPGEVIVTNGTFLIDSESKIKMGTGSSHQH